MSKSTPSRHHRKRRPLFEFKVWIDQSTSGIFSAQCLETGAAATADSFDTVVSIMEEVLESEASLALDSNDFANLYSSPAPPEVWFRWNAMSAKQKPTVRTFEIHSRKQRPSDDGPSTTIPKKSVVSSTIEVARAVRQHA